MPRLALLLLLLMTGLFAGPALALDEIKYDVEFDQLVEPVLNTRNSPSTAVEMDQLLAFIDDPTTTARQRYLAWRAVGRIYLYNTSVLNEANRLRFQRQVAYDDDLLFQLRLIRHDPALTEIERQRQMEQIFERSLKEFANSPMPALAAGVLADLFTFGDNPLDAIIVLEKGLKVLDKKAYNARRYLYTHLAILYTDPFQSEENIRKGIALYKELEFINSQGRVRPETTMIFNQGIAYLFSLYDFDSAWSTFKRIDSNATGDYPETLIYGAASLVGLNRRDEALARIQEFDGLGYQDPSNRMIYLSCVREMVLFELGKRDDIKACHFVSDHYYSSAIDVVMFMDALIKRPLNRNEEYLILRNFREYFLSKFRQRIKNSTAKSISHLELERSRIEEERIRFEAALERKSSQLKTLVLYSTAVIILILALTIWRAWAKNRRIEALQNYIKTNILQRFLPEALIKEILQGRSRLEQEPQKKVITILFADLVAFSATTEALGTEAIARLLNDYLKAMTDVVFAEGGTIDKFIGDAVMVIFGAPFESSPQDQVQKAVHCAEHMFRALDELNRNWQREFNTSFQLRIGINTGEAIVGSFGSEKRSDYTVIGNAVNRAARIESMAPPGQIVMSRTSAEYYDVKNCASLGNFALKGVTGPQELFQVKARHDLEISA